MAKMSKEHSAGLKWNFELLKQFLKIPLEGHGVLVHAISTPPVALPQDHMAGKVSKSEYPSMETTTSEVSEGCNWKVRLEEQHRQECLSTVDKVFGGQIDGAGGLIIFNLFALEGWHLAELYCVPCAVAAPYVVPYSAPASFERHFRGIQPLLHKRLQNSGREEIGWGEIMHWMWPLFTDRWTEWRLNRLHLSACPLTDPVTGLPVLAWPCAPPLLYGFSKEVVEYPAYWPKSLHICGFWYASSKWDAMHGQLGSASNVSGNSSDRRSAALLDFLSASVDVNERPIFIGLSSIGSMGFLENPQTFLRLILEVLKAANKRALLFTSSYLPLDSAIITAASDVKYSSRDSDYDGQSSCEDLRQLKSGVILADKRLFCFSGFVSYDWLLPKCSIAIHHGGSGTTAAALNSGVPQIICPFLLDQFYWAERMAWIGVSPLPLKPHHLFPKHGDDFLEAVSTVVQSIVDASSLVMRDCAAAFSFKIRREDGVSRFVQILSDAFKL